MFGWFLLVLPIYFTNNTNHHDIHDKLKCIANGIYAPGRQLLFFHKLNLLQFLLRPHAFLGESRTSLWIFNIVYVVIFCSYITNRNSHVPSPHYTWVNPQVFNEIHVAWSLVFCVMFCIVCPSSTFVSDCPFVSSSFSWGRLSM